MSRPALHTLFIAFAKVMRCEWGGVNAGLNFFFLRKKVALLSITMIWILTV